VPETALTIALCAGSLRPLPDGKVSGIDKRALDGEVHIGRLGLEGDAQADRKHHGGEHMAVHHYSADHYPYWMERIPHVSRLAQPGAFGENIHATGLTETDVFIGDRFRLGKALLEVSMGRQPCSTLERHFVQKDMVRRIIKNHKCGWYYRVIEEGTAKAGDTLGLVERPQQRWSVDRAFDYLHDKRYAGENGDGHDLLSLTALGPQWQTKVIAKLG